MDLFHKNTVFRITRCQLMDWIIMVWITLWIIVMFSQLFGLSYWRHPFTAKDLFVSKWRNVKFLQICFWLKDKLLSILDGLRVNKLLANFHFWVNIPLNVCHCLFSQCKNRTNEILFVPDTSSWLVWPSENYCSFDCFIQVISSVTICKAHVTTVILTISQNELYTYYIFKYFLIIRTLHLTIKILQYDIDIVGLHHFSFYQPLEKVTFANYTVSCKNIKRLKL